MNLQQYRSISRSERFISIGEYYSSVSNESHARQLIMEGKILGCHGTLRKHGTTALIPREKTGQIMFSDNSLHYKVICHNLKRIRVVNVSERGFQ